MPLGEFKKIYHMMFLKGPYINHNITLQFMLVFKLCKYFVHNNYLNIVLYLLKKETYTHEIEVRC